MDASFAGEKDFQGKKTLAVDWQHVAGKATLFFDPASHLLVGAAYKSRTPQGGETDTVNIWSEHKAVDGVQFPFHWVTMRDGAKFSEQSVKEVKLNVAVDAKQFSKPN
ncbi:MAG: hypothetical protein HY046_05025 [Acidobacteria bacterium]|nr:hypothetical protein [Acidobacteriota bacterium]